MAQIVSPDEDITVGDWAATGGPSTLFDCVDDGMASDGAYMSTGTDTTAELGLPNLTDPGGTSDGTDHILRIRMQGNGSAGPERVQIALYEGATERSISAVFTSRAAWTTQTHTLLNTEADLIGDYTNLRVRIISSNLAGGETMWVSGVEFEIPDPSVGGGTTYIQGGLINGGLINTSLINDSLIR